MEYKKIVISIPDNLDQNILIAKLSELNIAGIEEHNKEIDIWFEENNYDETALSEITNTYQLEFSRQDVPQKNWNELWESNFEPVMIDEFCVIKADFHTVPNKYKHEILITPKMSFGTGHHATTQLMIRAISTYDFTSKKVLDFGTGTGILAILAEQLGANQILAIDNDEWCIENAHENTQKNNCKNIKVSIDNISGWVSKESFDIILANINRSVLLDHMGILSALMSENGQLIISGILLEDEDILEQCTLAEGLILKSKTNQSNWSCMTFYKK